MRNVSSCPPSITGMTDHCSTRARWADTEGEKKLLVDKPFENTLASATADPWSVACTRPPDTLRCHGLAAWLQLTRARLSRTCCDWSLDKVLPVRIVFSCKK